MKLIIARNKRYGGISTFLLNLIGIISKRDEEFTLLLHPNISTNILSELKSKFTGDITFFPSDTLSDNLLVERFKQGVYIRRLKKKLNIDRMIIVDWSFLYDWISILNTNSIVFVHTYPTRKLPKIIQNLSKNLCKKTNIFTVSFFSKSKIYENWGLTNSSVIYNFSSLPGSQYSPTKNSNETHIVTIAHVEDYKNPELWLEIARDIVKNNQSVYFHWYGDGTLYNEYREATSNDNNIIFHGYTRKIPYILEHNTDIYLQCSKIESLGISILDAMNYSKPIIIANTGGMPELLDMKNNNGFVCTTKNDFIYAIKTLVENHELYQELSANSKEIYETKFSKEVWLKNINQIL